MILRETTASSNYTYILETAFSLLNKCLIMVFLLLHPTHGNCIRYMNTAYFSFLFLILNRTGFFRYRFAILFVYTRVTFRFGRGTYLFDGFRI